jgi:putative SOS response-associated peptidase YedK
MCGRYASSRGPDDLVAEFGVERVAVDERLTPNYNVAPTDDVYAVLERIDKSNPDAGPQRQLRVVRWGLVPSWAKDPKIGSRLINARVETLGEKPAFRKAFSVRRCLLPADGYYEWYDGASAELSDGPRGHRKQPFFIHDRGGGILAMAGLYEFWRDPRAPEDADPWLWSCTVITTDATDDVERIHDRTPMLIDAAHWDEWLDPRLHDQSRLRDLLVPAGQGKLGAYAVSTDVNDVKNNGPDLLRPIDGVALPL